MHCKNWRLGAGLILFAALAAGCNFFTSVQMAPGETSDCLVVKYMAADKPGVLIFTRERLPGAQNILAGWKLDEDVRGDAREAVQTSSGLLVFYEKVAGLYKRSTADAGRLERTVIELPKGLARLAAAAVEGNSMFLVGEDDAGAAVFYFVSFAGDSFSIEYAGTAGDALDGAARVAAALKYGIAHIVVSARYGTETALRCWRVEQILWT